MNPPKTRTKYADRTDSALCEPGRGWPTGLFSIRDRCVSNLLTSSTRTPKHALRIPNWVIRTIIVCGIQGVCAPTARSQVGSPPAVTSTVPASTSLDELLQRLRSMEDTNNKLVEELKRTTKEHDEQIKQLHAEFGTLSKRLNEGDTPGRKKEEAVEVPPLKDDVRPAANDTPVPDYLDGTFPAPELGVPTLPSLAKPRGNPLKGYFGPGFQFQTEDERFRFQVHYESQIEGRAWGRADQVPANSGIFLPRQRIFFNGNIGKPVEYEFAINRGLGNINILNAYINLHLDDRFEVRFGRFFTPLNYDQYAISNYWLPTPERSIFTTNVGLNRQFGLMAWGYLFDKRLDYAAGAFNGSRNSFESLTNSLDFVGYLNVRPFQDSESMEFLRFLNLGTSIAYGHQDQSPVPSTFRIAGGSPDSSIPGSATVPFLILNPNVIERGERLIGSVHTAYYYKGLSVIGEWQYGYGNYATPAQRLSTQVPYSGFYLTGAYFLTGEHIERRTRVKPLRPFIPLNSGDERGPGAWEAVGRVSGLSIGNEVFTSGFADPSHWSNRAVTTELGLNWYLNDYMKVYIFWLHGKFADPVQTRPGGFATAADLFWLRFQLYF